MAESTLKEAPAAASAKAPLVVDMDGTLLKTDTLFEGLAASLFRRPFATVAACLAIVRGKAAMKARLADLCLPDTESLPLNEAFVAYLRKEKAAGRPLHLVSAANERLARAVAAPLGLFETVEGSSATRNLKGAAKRAALEARFPAGFSYAGDARADLAVWRGAKSAVLVSA
ncbi:MAG: haloacid dehalogenase-like hydrolase, partial [Methylocystis sp.]|uniref:haloacid dehalogenase-like hydrolase n=1 Tax=Methylocystis sp. TaxID=1911079 RepID=UPI003D1408C7